MTETLEVLEEALRDHLSDLGMLTDWVVVAATTELEDIGTGRTSYTLLTAPSQPVHVTFGLLHHAIDYGEVEDGD